MPPKKFLPKKTQKASQSNPLDVKAYLESVPIRKVTSASIHEGTWTNLFGDKTSKTGSLYSLKVMQESGTHNLRMQLVLQRKELRTVKVEIMETPEATVFAAFKVLCSEYGANCG